MNGVRPKRVMFGHVARLAQALANPIRIEIVDLLAQAPRSVDALSRLTEQSRANISQHLQAMRAAGVVTARRQGKNVIYALSDEIMIPLYDTLSAATDAMLAEAALARQTLYGPLDPEEPVPLDDLAAALDREAAVLIDVRPREEFLFDHIETALSFPVSDLAERVGELPKRRLVVAYCRGPHCTYAHEAVKIVRSSGRRARRLRGGYLGWRSCNLQAPLRSRICGGTAHRNFA